MQDHSTYMQCSRGLADTYCKCAAWGMAGRPSWWKHDETKAAATLLLLVNKFLHIIAKTVLEPALLLYPKGLSSRAGSNNSCCS